MLSTMEKLRLNGELKRALNARNTEKNALKKLRLVKMVQDLRKQLGLVVAGNNNTEKVPEKRDTGVFYTYEEKRTKSQRQKANNAAIELLNQFNDGMRSRDSVTDADREILAKYTGSGGNLTTAEGKKGSAYEYYTPKPIAQGAWDLLKDMGFAGGKVLDPCAGVGIFSATSPLLSVAN